MRPVEKVALVFTFSFLQVWFSNRRARLRKTAQTCSSPGYNPLGLNMSGYNPAYMHMDHGQVRDFNKNACFWCSVVLRVCLRHEVRNPRLPDKPVSFWLPQTRLVTCYAQSRVSPIVTQLQDCNDSAAQNGYAYHKKSSYLTHMPL